MLLFLAHLQERHFKTPVTKERIALLKIKPVVQRNAVLVRADGSLAWLNSAAP